MKTQRPKTREVRSYNTLGLIIESDCRLPEIKFYVENGSVHFFVTVLDTDGKEFEVLQYLDAKDAMKFAKAMEACAIQVLKEI